MVTVHILILILILTVFLSVTSLESSPSLSTNSIHLWTRENCSHSYNFFWRWVTSGSGTATSQRAQAPEQKMPGADPGSHRNVPRGCTPCLCHAHRPIAALPAAPTRRLRSPVTNCNRIGGGTSAITFGLTTTISVQTVGAVRKFQFHKLWASRSFKHK